MHIYPFPFTASNPPPSNTHTKIKLNKTTKNTATSTSAPPKTTSSSPTGCLRPCGSGRATSSASSSCGCQVGSQRPGLERPWDRGVSRAHAVDRSNPTAHTRHETEGGLVALQPHTAAFSKMANPHAVLESELKYYSCVTKGVRAKPMGVSMGV